MEKKVKIQIICYSIIGVLWLIIAGISLFFNKQMLIGSFQAALGVIMLVLAFIGYRVNREK